MRLVAWLVALTAICSAQTPDYAGTWVMKSAGQPVFKLNLTVQNGRVSGSMTKPSKLSIDADGDVTEIGPEHVTLPVQKARLKPGQLELRIDDNDLVMTLQGEGAVLAWPGSGFRPWKLERVAHGVPVVLASRLPEPEYPPDIRELREQLRAMIKEDQDSRMAFDNARIDAVDAKDRPEVLRIYARYGWVTISLAGKDASHNFWLLVQHQTPEIQQQMLPALEKAAKAGDASMGDYAYLYDRVQVGLGKPQHWGSQTKCVNGKPVLSPVDDPAGLEARRQELFMPPVRVYLKMDYLIKACAKAPK